jgi:cystathionine beta-lyase/cystathionine gamma-synthase
MEQKTVPISYGLPAFSEYIKKEFNAAAISFPHAIDYFLGGCVIIGEPAKEKRIFAMDRYRCSSISFSPDGKYIASGGWDDTLRLWDVNTGEMVKYFAGHNDVIAGAIITKNKKLHEKLQFLQRTVGAILSPDECYRVIQGVKTLDLRWRRVSNSAQKIAEFLETQTKIKKVFYPGLKKHPNHKIAVKQMKNGFGAVVSFELKENKFNNLKKFVNTLTKDDIIIYGESLASPESILAYPKLMSHGSLSAEDRKFLGISDSFFRFSVGFEEVEDIIEKFKEALRVI